jgi:hypothetical protein
MKSYCLYNRLERKVYLGMLVKTSLYDSQLRYGRNTSPSWARSKTEAHARLLRINGGAGHALTDRNGEPT